MQYNKTLAESTAHRERWLDCAKGIGALLVILGHTYYIPAALKFFIYSFHMPLFFILSGMTMRISDNKPFRQTVIKYARVYLIPYLVLSLINLVLQSLWLLWIGQLTLSKVLTYLAGIAYCYANMDWMPNCSPLWFLPCTFICKLLFLIILRRVPQKLQLPSILACAGISYVLYLTNAPRLPWNLATALMAISFLWIGWYLQNKGICKKLLHLKTAAILMLLLVILSPFLIANGGKVGMNENTYGNILWFFTGGVGYSLAVIVLSHKISGFRFFTDFLGRNTIIVIGFNYFARHAATEFYYMIPMIRNIPINAISLFCGTFMIMVCIIFGWNVYFSKKVRT